MKIIRQKSKVVFIEMLIMELWHLIKFLQGNKKFLENADKCTLTRLLSHSVNTSLFDAAYTPEAVFKAEKLSTNGLDQP